MLAGLIGAAASGLKGAADAYSVGAKSEFDKNQKVELSQQLLDMEEQKALRVDEITRSRNIADVGRIATATADAAPTVARGVLAARTATAQGIKDSGIQTLEAENEVAGVNAKSKAGLPAAQAQIKAAGFNAEVDANVPAAAAKLKTAQLTADNPNVIEAAKQEGGAAGAKFNAEIGTLGVLANKSKLAAANESPSQRAAGDAQRALANFTLTNAKVLQDARTLLSKETDPEQRDILTRSIADLSGASTKNFGDAATAARSWVNMAQNLRKDAEMATPEDAKELTTRAQGYEQSADALLKGIAEKRLPGSVQLTVPPADAIKDLLASPATAPLFDKTFGKGSAAKYLKRS